MTEAALQRVELTEARGSPDTAEVKKPLLETSRKGYLAASSVPAAQSPCDLLPFGPNLE